MHLFDYLDSGNGYKVRLLLAQLGQKYEWTDVDIDKGQTRTPEFLKRNPNGRIPTLELDDGTYLPESNAILWYLAEGSRFVPATQIGRAQVLQWMFFEQYSHEPYVATPRYICRHFPADHPRRAELPDRLAKGRAALRGHGAAPFDAAVLRQRALQHRGHRAVRVYARGRGRRPRPRGLSQRARVVRTRGGAAGLRAAARAAEMSAASFARTPEPPYYAVIFTSTRTAVDEGYGAMADRMVELAVAAARVSRCREHARRGWSRHHRVVLGVARSHRRLEGARRTSRCAGHGPQQVVRSTSRRASRGSNAPIAGRRTVTIVAIRRRHSSARFDCRGGVVARS